MPVTPVIPFLGSFDKPLAHCNLRQVKSFLLGQDLSVLSDPDGTMTTLFETIVEDLIPEASGKVAKFCRTNFDYTREIWFFDGTGRQELVLPRRNILYVNAVFLRFLPSQTWYRFVKPRLIDGQEFAAIGGIEPPPPGPESLPPTYETPSYEQGVKDMLYTGTEDADLYVDPRRRLIVIPPRVLYAAVQSPIWNYDFFNATMNVEVHFAYGYAPTKYLDNQPLKFDPVTGELIMISPASPNTGCNGGALVDWSSGMPKAVSQACARLVYADILRRQWAAITQGVTSTSVDGASESYGGVPFGGLPDKIDADAYKLLESFAIRML